MLRTFIAAFAAFLALSASAAPTFKLSWDSVDGAGAYKTAYKVDSGEYTENDISITETGSVTILDDWALGTSRSVSASSNRALFVAVGQNGDVNNVTFGSQALTQVYTNTFTGAPGTYTIWVGYLKDSGIQAASGSIISVSGSGTPIGVHSVVLENVSQITPVKDYRVSEAKGTTVSSLTNPSALSISSNDYSFQTCVSRETGGVASNTAEYSERIDTSNNGTLATADRAASTTYSPQNTCTFGASTNIAYLAAFSIQPAISEAGDLYFEFAPSPAVQVGQTVYAKVKGCYDFGTSCTEGEYSDEKTYTLHTVLPPPGSPELAPCQCFGGSSDLINSF